MSLRQDIRPPEHKKGAPYTPGRPVSFCQRVLLAAFEGLVDIEEVRPVRHELHGLVELFALQAGIVGAYL